VSGGEAFRKGVALLVTLFLSLCIGLYASASTEDRFKALRRAWAWVVFSSLLLPVCSLPFYIAGGSRFPPALSPLWLTVLASSPGFGNSVWFWIAAAGLVMVAWVFLWRAGVRLRRSVRDESAEPGQSDLPTRAEFIAPSRNRWSLRRRYSSPEQWVTTRQRGMKTILWVGAIVGLLYLFAYRFLFMGWGAFGRTGLPWSVAGWLPQMLLSAGSGALFAWAASRFFIEGRKTGELELLLTTPVGAHSIVWGQWRSLRRALRGPVAAMLVFMFLPFAFAMMSYRAMGSIDADFIMISRTFSFVISGLNVFFGVQALCLAGLWFGIRASGQAQAILWTIAVAKGCPYLISLFGPLFLGVVGMVYPGSHSAYYLLTLAPSLATLSFYLWLIHTAKRKVLRPCAVSEPTLPPLSRAIRRLFLNLPEAIQSIRYWRTS
jgi:hypothetical protein